MILTSSWTQESDYRFDSMGSVDWTRGALGFEVSFDLALSGIRLPAGRFMAEKILDETYPSILTRFLLPIKADSNSSIGSLLEKGEVSREDLDIIILGAGKIPPAVSTDLLRMTGRYTVLLDKVSAALLRHGRAREPIKPLIPASTADYTGIIIIAEEELPIHGRRARAFAEPCLFPKIWDTGMNLIYERNMFEPGQEAGNRMVRYSLSESIFRPTPSGLDEELTALVGSYPLRILTREIFGIYPTDLVIDHDDAMKILSSENNRRLLREGRVVFVLNKSRLFESF